MKIISWNVNSVRARIENILNYIKDSNPDILLLQEIKTQNHNFPSDEFKKLGFVVIESVANFILVKLKNSKQATLIADELEKKNIFIRKLDSYKLVALILIARSQ